MRKFFVPGDAFYQLGAHFHPGIDRPTFDRLVAEKGYAAATENGVAGFLMDPAVMKTQIAIAKFTSGPRQMACKHVVREGAGAILCTQHPAAGLRCARCERGHLLRHDEQEEVTCDGCRIVGKSIHPLHAWVHMTGELVRDTGGYSRSFDGPVLLSGTGFCAACMDGGTTSTDADVMAALSGAGWRP